MWMLIMQLSQPVTRSAYCGKAAIAEPFHVDDHRFVLDHGRFS